MKSKVFFYIVLILFVLTIVLSLKISYAKYTLQVESNSISINTKEYNELTITNIENVSNEEDTYNITISNSNNYDVNCYAEAKNTNDLSQVLDVVQYETQGTDGLNTYYIISANSLKTIKVKVQKKSDVEYTTTESGNDNIIPITLYAKGIYPYKSNNVINQTLALLDSPAISYDIVYASNGGTGTTESQTGIKLDQDVVLRNNGFTKRVELNFDGNGGNPSVMSRYKDTSFLGWSYNGTNYSAGQTVRNLLSEPGTATMSARWASQTFDLCSASRTDYDFAGWYTAKTGGSYVGGSSGTYTISDSTTLWAHWTYNPYYTLGYNANGGTNEPDSETVRRGNYVTISSTKPTRSGYKFLFWTKSSNQINLQQYYAGDQIPMYDDIPMYAQWAPNNTTTKYTITFDLGRFADYVNVPSKTLTFGETMTIPSATFDYNGVTLTIGSWDTYGSSSYDIGDTYTAVENISFYPHVYDEDGTEWTI